MYIPFNPSPKTSLTKFKDHYPFSTKSPLWNHILKNNIGPCRKSHVDNVK